jgi:peptidoglycan/LPS O-acetylase OafA/YrhL
VFFTLSGFLITSLLLTEIGTTGGVDLGRFFARRLRRLMPAALACLALVLVARLLFPLWFGPSLPADALAALAYVANWRFWHAGQSYGALFASPSPLLHYWSLAIEEQFYIVFPVVIWFVSRRANPRRALAVALSAAIAASVTVTLVAAHRASRDFVYYSTITRCAELLVGALLALVLVRPDGTVAIRARVADVVRWCAPLGLGALLALSATTRNGDAWLYRGGLSAFSLVSALVIVGCLVPGPVRAALAWRPLRAIGAISYGLYLYHWPVFVVLTHARTGLGQPALITLRLAITVALAAGSARWLEQPIRTRRWLTKPRRAGLAPLASIAAVAALAASTLAFSGGPASATLDFDAASRELAGMGVASVPTSTTTTTAAFVAPIAAPDGAVDYAAQNRRHAQAPPDAASPATERVALFGDSTMLRTGKAVQWFVDTTGSFTLTGGIAQAGCGVGRGGERRYAGYTNATPTKCDWTVSWPRWLRDHDDTMAVVQVGPWDVADRRPAGTAEWQHIGQAPYDAFLLGELNAAMDMFAASGVRVAWLTAPHIRLGVYGNPDQLDEPTSDPARIDRFDELLRVAAATHPNVTVVDLAGWLAGQPGGEMDARLRPDGVHFAPTVAPEVGAWLGPQLVAVANHLG